MMPGNPFFKKRGIVRSSVRKDFLFFMLPWFSIFCAELLFCVRDGVPKYEKILNGVSNGPEAFFQLPVQTLPGLGLILLGFTAAITGRAALRRSYAATVLIHANHRLVKHGIFRYTRNPIYLGTLLVSAGFPVLALSMRGLAMWLLLIPFFLIRIRLEEKLLSDEFGESFEEYKKQTRRLIPFIY